jgi:hypothetical protein
LPCRHLPDSFQAFTVVMFQVQIYWVVTLCSVVVGKQRFRGPRCLHLQGEVHFNLKIEAWWTVLQPEDGGSKVLRNVGILPQHYTTSQPRRLCLAESSRHTMLRTQAFDVWPWGHGWLLSENVKRNRDNSVSTVIRLRAGRLGFDHWQDQWRDFFSSPPRSDRLRGLPSFLSNGHRGFFRQGQN